MSDQAPLPDCRAGGDPTQRDVERVLDVLGGKGRLQTISTLAALGIPDHLDGRARSPRALAEELQCDAQALDSLLRMAAGLGFLECPEPETFTLTRLGRQLKRDALGPLVEFAGAREQWDPWSRLRETVRGDDPTTPFAKAMGAELYDYLARSETAAERYDRAIDALTRHEVAALDAAFDFSGTRTLVDVGGGRGTLLLELAARHPQLTGVPFDLPHVAERSRRAMTDEQRRRVRCEGGDFFDSVPADADTYLMKHVLHNWDDARAIALLRRCADALPAQGHLLVVESITAPDTRPDLARMLDLEMAVLTGGRGRRKPEMRRLFAAAGLTVESITPMSPMSWLFVGRLLAVD